MEVVHPRQGRVKRRSMVKRQGRQGERTACFPTPVAKQAAALAHPIRGYNKHTTSHCLQPGLPVAWYSPTPHL